MPTNADSALARLCSLVGAASVVSEQDCAELRTALRAHLQRVVNISELQTILGLSDVPPEAQLEDESSLSTRCFRCLPGQRRTAMIDTLVSVISKGIVRHPEDFEEHDEQQDTDEVILAWLDDMCPADAWPADAPAAPPLKATEALDPAGIWGQVARGVQVRACTDASRGRGCFAVRNFAVGGFVGLYWGEALTAREYAVRDER